MRGLYEIVELYRQLSARGIGAYCEFHVTNYNLFWDV